MKCQVQSRRQIDKHFQAKDFIVYYVLPNLGMNIREKILCDLKKSIAFWLKRFVSRV